MINESISDREMHENWVRATAFEFAQQRNKYRPIEAIIDDAKKIEAYMLNRRPAKVMNLVVKNKSVKP
jgi:hypothetical protein